MNEPIHCDSAVRAIHTSHHETFFHFRTRGDGWCDIFVKASNLPTPSGSAVGAFTALSDLGAFGYQWASIGIPPNLTPPLAVLRFLARASVSPRYYAEKLARGRRDFDADGTVEAIREGIVELRRRGALGAREARVDWDAARDVEDICSFHEWCRGSMINEHTQIDPFEYARTCVEPLTLAFVRKYLGGRFARAAKLAIEHGYS